MKPLSSALALTAFALITAGGGKAARAGAEGGQPEGAPSPAGTTSTAVTITVTATTPTLTLGVDTATTLLVTVEGPLAAAAVPARTQATVGTIGPLIPHGAPGSFTAEYQVPRDRIPQSAIVSVEVALPGDRRVHATTRLLLPAATSFPLRTSPNAMVSLEIAGRLFGPQKADSDGNVSLAIVVPPYVASGRARAVNKFGIASETDVDLQPREYPRVLLIAPPSGQAGDTVEVEVWAVQPSGEPAPPEEIDLRASAGTVRRMGGVPGLARFAFTLPPQVGPGEVRLEAAMADGTSTRTDTVLVHAGPASEVLIASNPARLVVGSGSVAHLSVVARDRFGNSVPVDGMTITADGQDLPTVLATAEATAEIPAPATWTGRDHVVLQARLGTLQTTTNLRVTGGPPARAELRANRQTVQGNDPRGVEVLLELFDEQGVPTSATRVMWQTNDKGALERLPAPRFGTYAVRFVPARTLRDHIASISVTVDDGITNISAEKGPEGNIGARSLKAAKAVLVEAGPRRLATARVGVMSNLGGSFGQSAFLEATVPLLRSGPLARLFSAGLAAGYLHSQANIQPSPGPSPGLFQVPAQVNIHQVPILAMGRFNIPGGLPVQFSVSASVGMTFATTSVIPDEESPFAATRGSAHAVIWGAGADAAFLLRPGELVLGAHYLHAHLGRNSNGDHLDGNALGLIADLGFRLAF